MKAAIYLRVSTKMQLDNFSISAQKQKLEAFCSSQNWEIIGTYVEEGESAKSTERPELKRMMNHIKEGIIDVVVVYKLDRLTRSVVDLYNLLSFFEKYNCKFKSATEVYDTTTAIGRMFITLVASFAQFERENLGERVRMGQIEKARQGQYSAKAPYGYLKIENKLEPHPEESKVVLDIIDKVRQGTSIRQVAAYLDKTVPPIRGYKWHIATILDILHNPALHGATRWLDEVIEDTHSGLITKGEYEQLQQILNERQNVKKRETYSIFVFQMKLICPNCGNRLTSERSKYYRKRDKKYVESNHYRCQACVLNNRKSITVSEKKMEKGLLTFMENFEIEKVPVPKDKKNEVEKLRQELIKIENQREKYQKAWANNWMTDGEFSKHMADTREAMENVTKELESITPRQSNQPDPSKIKEIVKDFQKNWSYLEQDEKRQFIQTFIEKIQFELDEERKVQILRVFYY
ncbi:recombinase family protein [Sutcliffiella cohnii]